MYVDVNTGSSIFRAHLPRLTTLAGLLRANPFEPRWDQVLSPICPDLERIVSESGALLRAGIPADEAERTAYLGAVVVHFWEKYRDRLQHLIVEKEVEARFYDEFSCDYRALLVPAGIPLPAPGHLFATFYQARRAFWFPASKIRGEAPGAAAARSAIWRAIVGTDLCAYARKLHAHMEQIPVLITGEPGTGKDLAAQCVGFSRYIPFDEGARRFTARPDDDWHTRNVCEVPPELVESALFGHKRGAFTGAIADARGAFSLPGPQGTLFLDEIGELPEHVQAKLLRPLQSRECLPLGEQRPHPIHGRHVFATNRDLEALCREGKFRADLKERLNGARIHMPPLRALLAERPEDLRTFVATFVEELEMEEGWADRVVETIQRKRRTYLWPGNLRELRNYTQQFVLNDGDIGSDEPAAAPAGAGAGVGAASEAVPESTGVPSSGLLGWRAKQGRVKLEEIVRDYVTRVHVMTGLNGTETARRVGKNWRTIWKLMDLALLGKLLDEQTRREQAAAMRKADDDEDEPEE